MKLLTLSFSNLNSLKGHWHIDFTHSDFNDGIFAIVGKTGSGKTTILDAICLAIYGRTPRIKEITSAQNEIMSMDKGDCHAQVQLQIDDKMYRFFWGQHRARNKAGGNLQAIKREISEITHIHDNHAKPLDLKKLTDFNEKAIELLHMDFEQFTRSVMLAQGGFNAFLQADLDNKGKILEQITGTEIYGEISKKVHNINKEKQNAIQFIEEQINNQSLMNDDEFIHLSAKINELTDIIHHQKTDLCHTDNAIQILTQKEELDNTLISLQKTLNDKKEALAQFAPQLILLNKGKKAKNLKNTYNSLLVLTQKITDDKQHIKNLAQQNSQKQQIIYASKTKKQELSQALIQAKNNYQNGLAVFKQVKKLDDELYHYDLQIRTKNQEKDTLSQSLFNIENSLKNLNKQYSQTQQKLLAVQQTLKDQQNNKTLSQDIGILSRSYQNFISLIQNIDQLNTALTHKQQEQEIILQTNQKTKNLYKNKEQELNEKQEKRQQLLIAIGNLLKTDHYSDDLFFKTYNELQTKISHHRDLYTNLMDLDKYHQQYQELQQKKQQVQSQLKEATENHSQTQHTLNALENSLNDKKLQLINLQKQKEQLQQTINIQAYFDVLKENCPCPLCGSLTHPYKEQNHIHHQNDDIKNVNENINHTQELIYKISENLDTKKQSQYQNEHLIAKFTEQDKDYTQQLTQLQQQIQQIITHIGTLLPDFNHQGLSKDVIEKQLLDIKTSQKALEQTFQNFYQYQEDYQTLLPKIQETEKQKTDCEKLIHAQNQQQNQLAYEISLTENQINLLNHDAQEIIKESNQKWQIYHLSALDKKQPINDLSHVFYKNLSSLSIKEKELQSALDEQNALYDSLNKTTLQLEHEKQNQQSKNIQLMDLEQSLKELLAVKQSISKDRFDLFGDKHIDTEQNKLIEIIDDYQHQLEILQNAFNQDNNELLLINQELQLTKQNLISLEDEQKITQHNFDKSLKEQGFIDVSEFLSARLDDDTLTRLENTEKSLTLAITVSQEQLQLAQKQRQELTQKTQCLDKPLGFYQAQKQDLQLQIDNTLKTLGEKNERLKQENNLRLKNQQLLQQLQDKKQDAKVWQKLNELIGSHDGKKYRSFVQGLTLKMVLHHANKFLAKINDRYVLYHETKNKDSLDISIIDTHQGSETRSTKNLSGGESFIVSLSLAMGLSMINSENVRIDSLFLDEGFGTLDNDALDVVLSTLSSLNETGKTIAIISHVKELNEQINTKIVVNKLGSGSSGLSGSGVSQIKTTSSK